MKISDVKRNIIQKLHLAEESLVGYKVVLFGSRAGKNAHARSDFDVGVIGEKPLPRQTFYRIESYFDEIETLYTIDWIDFSQTTQDFREEALKQVEVLYEG